MSSPARSAARSRRASVGPRQVAIMAMAAMGPTAAIALDFPAMSGSAGPAFVLSLLIALAAVACIASAVRELVRWYPHPGTFYAWGARAFGARGGFLLGWVLLGAYLALAASGLLLFGGWGAAWLSSFGLPAPWWAWSTAALGYVTIITVRGLRASVRGMIVLLAFQVLAVAVVALVAFTAAPPAGYDSSRLVGGVGWPGVPLAMAAGILSCVGFEQAATLAEETEHPRDDLPRGVFTGAVLVPAFYVVVAVALVVGLGPRAVAGAVPLQDAASIYLGPGGSSLVVAAGLGSALALTQAVFGAAARLIRAMARDGQLPRVLAVTHPDFGTPYVATFAVALVGLVVGWSLAIVLEPVRVWADLAVTFSALFLVAYLCVNVVVVVCVRRDHPAERSVVRHLVLPAAAIAAAGYALYLTIWPFPGPPYAYFGAAAGLWIVLGAILVVVRRRRFEGVVAAGRSGEPT
ncbi:MAG: APC family permease [Streptosporangiaceae bacterium]